MLEKLKNYAENVKERFERIFSGHKELWLIPAIIFLALGLARFTSLFAYRVSYASLFPQTNQGGLQINNSAPQRQALPEMDVMNFLNGSLFSGSPTFQTTEAAAVVAGPQEEDIPFVLLGTLEGDPSFARAIVRLEEGDRQTREYGVRQRIGATRILAIRRNYIWAIKNGVRFKVEVGKTSTEALQAMPAPTTQSGGTIVKVISREDINQKILGNPSAIYKGARFGPLLENDKIVGYKLYQVEPSHVFYALGARSGDVIKSANGYPLGDTDRMFELWRAVPGMDKVDVVIDRDGKELHYQFHIRN